MDTQNVRNQTVISSELLDLLPSSTKHWGMLVQVTAGFTGQADVSGTLNQSLGGTYHGKAGSKRQFEGICRQVVQTVFHPESVRPRLKALHDLLRDDIADDRNPAKFTPPPDAGSLTDYHWNVGHFDYGYDDGNWKAHGVR